MPMEKLVSVQQLFVVRGTIHLQEKAKRRLLHRRGLVVGSTEAWNNLAQ